jgi:hypothetical protein
MKRAFIAFALLTSLAHPAATQTNDPTLFISPTDDGFEVYLTHGGHA